MPYTTQTWQDNAPAPNGQVTAARLNHIEAGIDAATDTADSAMTVVTVDDLPGGFVQVARKTGGVWPARPTARSDVTVFWLGALPAPSIAGSGTGGARDGIDVHLVTP